MDKYALLKTYTTRLDAEIHKSKLEAYGIDATIIGDDEGGMAPFPFQPAATGIKLLVQKKDMSKAQNLENSSR